MKGLARLAVVAALAFAPAGRTRRHEGARRSRQEGRRAHLVRRALYVGGRRGTGAEFTKIYGIKVNVVRTTAQVAYQRLLQDLKNNQIVCDVFSSTDVGHDVRLKAEGKFEKYMPETASKILPAVPELRSRRLLPHDVGRPRRAHLQHRQGEARGGAQEVAGPARHQVEGQGLDRPSGFLGLCRHLGADDEEPLRLGLFRQAGEEQAADRPLDQRHGDGAQRRRAAGGGRRRRLDAVQRRARQSAGGRPIRATAPC